MRPAGKVGVSALGDRGTLQDLPAMRKLPAVLRFLIAIATKTDNVLGRVILLFAVGADLPDWTSVKLMISRNQLLFIL